MINNTVEAKRLDLTCPHCGSKLLVLMEENNNRRSFDDPTDIPCGFECSRVSCWAEWDLDGNPISDPAS